MNENKGIIVITGASGFLGTNLCKHFHKQGYQVRALVRNKSKSNHLKDVAKAGLFEYDLGNEINPEMFTGEIETVIHCAWAVSTSNQPDAFTSNFAGTQKLIAAVRQCHGARFVFISSMSAHDDAESAYGRGKKCVEGLLDPVNDVIIKPGLIIGDGGLFARMKESIVHFPIVPLFYGGKQVIQVIQISDLCIAIELVNQNGLSGILNIAVNTPIQIRSFYNGLAAQVGQKCRFVHLPGTVSLWALMVCERLGINLPISSENLKGLKCMKTFDTQSDLARIGIEPTSDFGNE